MTRTYIVTGQERCSKSPPTYGTKVFMEPAVTGHGTVYLAEKAYAKPADSFGWIPKAAKGPTKRCMGIYRYDAKAGHDVVDVIDEDDITHAKTEAEAIAAKAYATAPSNPPPLEKTTMSKLIAGAVTANKSAATSAAFMEAGRVANSQVAKAVAKKAPMLVRGYVEHPVGKLVIANVAVLAAQQFRPNDKSLGTLAQAMAVQAYQELIQQLNIEEFIDDLLTNKDIKRALAKLPGVEGADGAAA